MPAMVRATPTSWPLLVRGRQDVKTHAGDRYY